MNMYIKEHEGYLVKPHKENPSCYVVVTQGKGGKIPDVLAGMFTSRTIAIEGINAYLASKAEKETIDEKGGSSRGK